MSSFYEFTCYGYGGPSDTPLCYLCTCEQCGNIFIEGACLKCNSGAENSFNYDPNPESFNEVQSIFNPPPQSHYNIYLCQICESNSHYGYECSQRVPLVYEPEPCYNQSFGNNAYPHDLPGVTLLIDHHCCYKCGDSLDGFFCNQCTCELCEKVNPSLNIQNELSDHELFINELIQQKLQNKYAQPFSAISITFDLPTVEPEDSLRMRDKHFDTIPEMESDEFIKSSVENLVSSPSESEDEHECDVPACDDFTTFSNLLFDADDDFSSSDSESFCDEDISKEIYLNPMFDEEIISIKIDPYHFNDESDLIESLLNHDSSIISSSLKIDSFLDEFAGKLILLKTIPSGIDETDCDPEKEIRLIDKLLTYTARHGEKKHYSGSKPLCSKSNYHHDGPCAPKCHKCNRFGHLARDCRSSTNANTTNIQKGTGASQKATCYECRNQGHYKRDCPEQKNQNHENQIKSTKARGVVHAFEGGETEQDLNNIEDEIEA
nr:hypothetical protein [Tanacetum cinerariifolium]